MTKRETASRREFLTYGVQASALLGAGMATSPAWTAPRPRASRPLVIDGMMHLEVWAASKVRADYWEGLVEQVLEHYEAAGIDKGAILTTWTPTRESNDRTLRAFEKYPDRFIPFGHVRSEDPDWQRELKRVSKPPWKGLKLHQAELVRGSGGLKETTKTVVRNAAELGIRVIKIHLVDYPLIDELTRERSEVTWILPHMGCFGHWGDMQKYCELANSRKNVYLDTSAVAPYWEFGKAFRWAGVDKITFASDGFMLSPLVKKAKIETLRLPTPHRTPKLTDRELAQILGGNMARILGIPDMQIFMNNDDVQVVAICDVNTASYGYRDETRLMGREPALEIANKYYADKTRSGRYKGVDAYNDFRKIIDRDDIDAVAVVTPDHWHGVMTIMVAEAGKDIFCQKPLSLTIHQGQEMIKAVRKHKRILQTGSQFRSNPAARLGCELIRNGRIGRLKTIHTFIPPNNKKDPGPGWKPMPVPDGFDYNTWLGPAPDAPYHKDRCLYKFRFNLDYSGGQITNFGAHSIDVAQLANGTSLTGPVEVEGLHAVWPPKGSLFTTALEAKFRVRYANGVELICETKEPGFGARFEGTEGWIQFGFKGITTHPASLADSKIGPDEIHLPKPVEDDRRDTRGHGYYNDHIRNFLDCVKSRQEPIEPVEIGHRTASICHLGNIGIRLMRKLQWDPEEERFVGDEEANRMLARPMRAPWHL